VALTNCNSALGECRRRVNRDQVIEVGLRGHVRFDPDSDHDRTALQYVAKGQYRTHAPQQVRRALDELVGSTLGIDGAKALDCWTAHITPIAKP
jgi:hypothetical protein